MSAAEIGLQRAGTRGTQGADKLAGQMRAPAAALGSGAAIADVIADIKSLEPPILQ